MPFQVKEKFGALRGEVSTWIGHISYLEVLIFLATTAFFGAILLIPLPTDAYEHSMMIQKTVRGNLQPPANFLYYLTVYVVAFLNVEAKALFLSSAIVLGASVTAKFILTRNYVKQIYHELLDKSDEGPNPNGITNSTSIVPFLSFLLIIVFSLPVRDAYLGQIPPNIWHNSTTIFLMPFALALFWLSYRQLLAPKQERLIPITILSVLNVITKPSFMFVFIISYPLMLVKQFGFKKQLWKNLIPVAIALVVIALMYHLIFNLFYGSYTTKESSVVIRPFSMWSAFSPNILQSLGASLIFPISYLVLYPKDLAKHLLIQYASLSYGIGVLIFALFYETGQREGHGNFLWQAVVCSYILFLCLSTFLIDKIRRFGIFNWKNIILLLAFTIHVLAGILYIIHYFVDRTYI